MAWFGLIFVAIGLLLVIFREQISNVFGRGGSWPFSRLPENFKRWYIRIFSYVYLGFALVWTFSAAMDLLQHNRTISEAVINGEAQVIAGPVEHSRPWNPHTSPASFVVQGHRFEYWGLNPGPVQGAGPTLTLANGDCVRITYYGETIIRIDRAARLCGP